MLRWHVLLYSTEAPSARALFEAIDKLHIKAARQIHDIPANYADHQILKLLEWHNLAYICKKRVAVEMFQGCDQQFRK